MKNPTLTEFKDILMTQLLLYEGKQDKKFVLGFEDHKKLIINDPLLCMVKTAKHVSSTRKGTPESKQ